MTDKKYTDEEIIKALEDYIKENEFEYFHSNMMNEYPLIRKSFELINRQKETIETLKKCVEQHHIIRKDGKSPLSLLTEEIRAEAYKEFAKKLKEEIRLEDDCYYNCRECCYECNDYVIAIDNLLKEMVGEEE